MRIVLLLITFLSFGFVYGKTKTDNCYHYTFTDTEHKKISLQSFKGKKILIVNVASRCGYTSQLKALEKLYKTYQDKLVIIGFPTNDFKNQTPENDKDFHAFCQKNYGVTFPISEKIVVTGAKKDPLYIWLTNKKLNGILDATITWNFNKFLIDENGRLITKFDSKVSPLDESITQYLQ